MTAPAERDPRLFACGSFANEEPELARALAVAEALGREHGSALEELERESGDATAARRALALVAERGLTAWVVPAACGGCPTVLAPPGAVSVRALSALRECLAYHHGLLDLMLVMQGLGSYPIALGGSEALAREVLPQVARGERIAAFGLTEPNAGSNLGEVATRAERNGDGWRLFGHKTFISNVGVCDFATVLARTAGATSDRDQSANLTMFYVPTSTEGVRSEPFEVLAPHPIGDLYLDGVSVPDEARLGAVGAGLGLALETLARFRTSVAAAACGFARRALDESVRRLATRVQFGRPLAAQQGLRFDLAEMDVRLAAADLLVREAAGAVDRDGEAIAAVARAKYWATESASWICDRAVQHFGGLGVKRGVVVERLFRDVRALRIYEGTSEVQKLILARELLAAART